VFKKLDKLIVKAFIGPFIATFFITLLVLLMQFFWLYIDDFVGKGLGIDVVLKFIWYQSAVLVTLALPLAILLSSLMTFGNLGESFELVAIKSSGISLLRFMRPLFIIAVLLSGVAFLFSNFIIPVAYLKSRTLLSDIVYAKPAFDLKEGEFYDKIKGFAIKIGKKEANDSVIRDVIVYEQDNPLQDNFIIAKSGIMKISENKRYLEFNLQDGWRYQERGNENAKTEYIRLGFKEYKKQFDLSSFMFAQTPDSLNRNNERVYSMRQLNKAIDSLKRENDKIRTQLQKGVYSSLLFIKYFDSTGHRKTQPDSAWKKAKNFDAMIPDSARQAVHDQALTRVNSVLASLGGTQLTLKDQERTLRKHKIEWHRKLVLSLACVILFLVGAPLGSIIRKGGLGTPLIAAISFFMVFYFSTTMGEKFAKENTLTPFSGMWLAAFILVPVGIFLTYKAMRDSQLFNKEWYYRSVKSFRAFIGRRRARNNSEPPV
jgi:lipopolysaccharide export system permease protein